MKHDGFDDILNQTFAYAKKIAKEFYFAWTKEPPRCLAFGGEVVYITREGWDHVRFERGRTKQDVLGRLFVLERAKVLLATATIFQDHVQRSDRARKHEYWIIEGIVEGVSIRVIVRSIGGGPKHFLSVIKKGTVEREIVDDFENQGK